jgi:Phosphodiester glycosidase
VPLAGTGTKAGTKKARQFHFAAHVRIDGYERYQVSSQIGNPQCQLVAQVLVIPSGRFGMTVREDQDVIKLDFRHTVTRPDLAGLAYQQRPGQYLADVLRDLRRSGSPAVLLNGNNVGWWGNQFVIRRKQLRFKPKGPIFDDGDLPAHVSRDHAFFLHGPSGYQIVDIKLHGTARAAGDTTEMDLRALRALPRYGLSGFPLIRHGKAVWEPNGEKAWDPGLLFDLGASRLDTHRVIREFVRTLIDAGECLARHPMTVIGLDSEGRVVLLVVEKSHRSRGITVAEAARLLRRRFHVRDAIVLGAAGDAQLATTAEGFLTVPLVTDYARSAARTVPDDLLCDELKGQPVHARPVPCYVLLRPHGTEGPAAGAASPPALFEHR